MPGRGDPLFGPPKDDYKGSFAPNRGDFGIQSVSILSHRIPMALAVTNLPGFEFYDVLKLNTPNPGYLILTPKIPISTSKP